MRIITGTARGCQLATLEGEATRPTMERVKEAVFSMIQFDIEGRNVLDLFAGSGQMGLEAVSRGAAKATFIDISREVVDIVIANAKKARLFEKCRVSLSDFTPFLKGAKGKEKYNIIFIDPPYNLDIMADVLKKIKNAEICADGCILVCETGASFATEGETFGDYYEVIKTAKYSRTYITLLTVKNEESGDETEQEQ
jgi:RNA methyltransferase, RsmD family